MARCALALVLACVALGCDARSRTPQTEAVAARPRDEAPPPSSPFPVGTPMRAAVAGDSDVHVVHAPHENRRALVYLHGKCAELGPDLRDVAGVTAEHGTIVALVGDDPCPGAGMTKWTADATAIHARIEAALRAVEAARAGALDVSEVTLIGESQGASRAEALATKYPDRYTRLVLVGPPAPIGVAGLSSVRAVATVAGERETHEVMIEGARALSAAGKQARYFEIPGAAHGDFGPEGGRVMREALAFVHAPD